VRWDRMASHSPLQEARSSLWLEDLYTDVSKGGGLGSVGKEKMRGLAAEISSPVPPGPVPNHDVGATKSLILWRALRDDLRTFSILASEVVVPESAVNVPFATWLD
jgi:hypothetical protein